MSTVAAIQMVSTLEVRENLESAGRLIEEAAFRGAEVVFLPENFPSLGHPDPASIGVHEMDPGGPVRSFLAREAGRHGIWLVAGTLPVACAPEGKKVRAACFVYDPRGMEVARYDKMHLFDVEVADNTGTYFESETVDAGREPQVVDTPAGRIGLTVCYDIRFSALYEKLAEMGAEILSVPAAFTRVTGAAHWRVLTRARAIENFCYLVGAAQGGDHACGRETFGHSLIVDPWGEVLAELELGEGVITAEIDLARLAEIRRDIPVYSHKRFRAQLREA